MKKRINWTPCVVCEKKPALGQAVDYLKDDLVGSGRGWNERTNLRFTGQPLTSEDIQRIATCEVK